MLLEFLYYITIEEDNMKQLYMAFILIMAPLSAMALNINLSDMRGVPSLGGFNSFQFGLTSLRKEDYDALGPVKSLELTTRDNKISWISYDRNGDTLKPEYINFDRAGNVTMIKASHKDSNNKIITVEAVVQLNNHGYPEIYVKRYSNNFCKVRKNDFKDVINGPFLSRTVEADSLGIPYELCAVSKFDDLNIRKITTYDYIKSNSSLLISERYSYHPKLNEFNVSTRNRNLKPSLMKTSDGRGYEKQEFGYKSALLFDKHIVSTHHDSFIAYYFDDNDVLYAYTKHNNDNEKDTYIIVTRSDTTFDSYGNWTSFKATEEHISAGISYKKQSEIFARKIKYYD